MGANEQPRPVSPEKPLQSFGGLKADFETIRLILITAAVVVTLMAVPLFFILRNFVTFDALDKYVGVTQNVQPKILQSISEELDSGYSRDFFIDSSLPLGSAKADNTMLFYSTPGQRVVLIAQGAEISGPFSPVSFQVDGCAINQVWEQPFSLLEFDLSKPLTQCSSDQPNLHTLRVILPKPPKKGSNMEIKSLVVVYHRVHEHVQ
jgi:hypothetical protein